MKQVFLGGIVLVGIYFLTPEFNLQNNYTLGVIFGLISSVFYALINILLKQKIDTYNGSVLIFYQMLPYIPYITRTRIISLSNNNVGT